jgi:hypothetical protein
VLVVVPCADRIYYQQKHEEGGGGVHTIYAVLLVVRIMP